MSVEGVPCEPALDLDSSIFAFDATADKVLSDLIIVQYDAEVRHRRDTEMHRRHEPSVDADSDLVDVGGEDSAGGFDGDADPNGLVRELLLGKRQHTGLADYYVGPLHANASAEVG
mmetsp:Transcript_21850/g.16211  ORF Transcript_21850/g.16211 Transcript_21850/m.16211 type:complete len:116 (-) Transcript_21850:1052-1399(-)